MLQNVFSLIFLDETQQPVHAGFNKLEHHQFNEFMQRNPVSTSLPYQPSISQEKFFLNNEFLSDNNNSEMNLIDSFNTADVNNNQSVGGTINQGLLPSYENLWDEAEVALTYYL